MDIDPDEDKSQHNLQEERLSLQSQRECDEISNNVFPPVGGRHVISVIGESQPVYVSHIGPHYEPMDESSDNDTPRVPRYSLTTTRNQTFNIEQNRYESFRGNWPSYSTVSADSLAKAGFCYLGPNDRVECVFCNGILANWEQGDNPQTEHSKHFPNCPFVKGHHVNNVPYQRHIASIQRNIPAQIRTTLLSHHPSKQEIKHPQYRIKAERLVTFNDWPSQMRQKPEDLAEAGLFYLGHGDKVKCFVCDGMLHSWEYNDEPWIEHAKWFPYCDYVKMVKGEDFIKGVENGEIQTLHQKEAVDSSSSLKKSDICTQRVEKRVQMGGTKSILERKESMTMEPKNEEYTSLIEENRNLKDQRLCKICLENEISIIFLPCGHVCCCGECSMSVKACPICRNDIERRTKAFLP
ncbi:hypothetical protein LOTGIDRAFT_203896 [Lottia gigantea]|uniref:RING-type domain-containing protein n=1 Tax=Lottia gigantea TaxID=225164 RepID=V4AM91_LOTGI|nr:hypothetical protein LOTGIDRAFT_203896 [Lottia gigantea]ESO94731.1 hypothetical protein LOTGIDRAFT_203896 [Lottia gigantea]